jgi:beta-lactamase class A
MSLTGGEEEAATGALAQRIDRIATEAGCTAVALALHDLDDGRRFGLRDDRWFHAASVIKLAVLMGLYGEIHAGRLDAAARLHVRNRFRSAVDSESFRVEASRDGDPELHDYVGRSLPARDLARRMVVRSSNLATNLLVEFLGVEGIRRTLAELGIEGVDLLRGVEDEAAHAAGIDNRVTAAGLLQLLSLLAAEEVFSAELSGEILDVLHAQEFRSGIPAGVPDDARVANKTGEISTVTHDAGIVFPAGRAPYALVILTEWKADAGGARRATLARLSREVYDELREGSDA